MDPNILILEDNEDRIREFERAATLLGDFCLHFWRDAQEMIMECPPLLANCSLGKGDELVRELRTSGNQAIIIGVSSHAEGNSVLMNAGANVVCSKMEFEQIEDVFDRLKTHRVDREPPENSEI